MKEEEGEGGTSFLIWQEAASVSSCEVAAQLISTAETLLLQLSVRQRDAATAGQRARGEGSPARGADPEALSDEFTRGKTTLTLTRLALWVSLLPGSG